MDTAQCYRRFSLSKENYYLGMSKRRESFEMRQALSARDEKNKNGKNTVFRRMRNLGIGISTIFHR